MLGIKKEVCRTGILSSEHCGSLDFGFINVCISLRIAHCEWISLLLLFSHEYVLRKFSCYFFCSFYLSLEKGLLSHTCLVIMVCLHLSLCCFFPLYWTWNEVYALWHSLCFPVIVHKNMQMSNKLPVKA